MYRIQIAICENIQTRKAAVLGKRTTAVYAEAGGNALFECAS